MWAYIIDNLKILVAHVKKQKETRDIIFFTSVYPSSLQPVLKYKNINQVFSMFRTKCQNAGVFYT